MARKRSFSKMALDLGNAQVKPKSEFGEGCIPHAIRRLSESDIQDYAERGELDHHPSIWNVDGVYYFIGERAMRKGAGSVLYGEARYTPEYYGTWAAISAFHVFPGTVRNIYLYGGHTSKDTIYRNDLIASVINRSFVVSHDGDTREFMFTGANGFEESVMVYRYATMTDEGKITAGWLRSGNCGIFDLGGFTLAVSMAIGGKIQYEESTSDTIGMLDVLDEFANLIRSKYRKEIKGMQRLDLMDVRNAFVNPEKGFDARGFGFLPCTEQAEQAVGMFTRRLDSIFRGYGGIGAFHTILLGGGGSAALENQVRATFNHPHVYMADETRNELHMAAVRGAWRILTLMESRGEL